MDAQLEQIREQQKEIWNRFSPGWKKWDSFNMNFLQPMGEAIIAYLRIKESDQVLDIATGTGEPGLTIATLARKGKVIGTDLSEGMLSLAGAHAALLAADAEQTTATAVAHAWGFLNYGRFAAEYRKLYGRSPSETLKSGELGEVVG